MFYPSNFPKQLEKPLIKLLRLLATDFQKYKPESQKKFYQLLKKNLAKKELQTFFNGKFPSLWFINFILYRHEKLFLSAFRQNIRKFLLKTKTRSISGIVPLSLFTKGVGCSFNCVYCPKEPNMPKSYFSDEPSVKRAMRNDFDPFKQTEARLIMFALSNHPIDKVEIIIKGGTFSFFPKSYRENFIKNIFNACNSDIIHLLKTGYKKIRKTINLSQAQKINEKAKSRVIGINIETRPDYINPEEIKFLRKLGITHVELGVQALDDKIYQTIKRGHTVESVKKATFLLKEAGFKIGYHLMPNLPGSSANKDLGLLNKAFTEDFSPDHLKLYPTTIAKYTELYEWFKKGKYKPYSTEELLRVIRRFKEQIVPPWVRIGRLVRDITTNMMEKKSFSPNLRQTIQNKMKESRKKCRCIRCREIKDNKIIGKTKLRIIQYRASLGQEYFLEFIDHEKHSLGFLRLRIPNDSKNSALIRELHIFGQAVPIGEKNQKLIQHKNLGKILLQKAEEISSKKGITKIKIISGVGAREYYRKLGYKLKDTYMVAFTNR